MRIANILLIVITVTICGTYHRVIARGGRILVTFIRPLDATSGVRIASGGGLALVRKSTTSGAVKLFAVADIHRKTGDPSNLL